MYKRAFFLILMQKKQHNLLFLDNFIKYNIIDSRKQVEKLAFLDYFY